jgi:hypothetical protein
MDKAECKGFRILAQDPLLGFGGVGEGMSHQVAPDGRRIMWLAHEGPPKNFTGVDVSDPRKPKVVIQTDLPHTNMRSNSLEVTGNIMAVAYQTYSLGERNAGIELFDIARPEEPKSIAFFDRMGPHSRGVHCLWFVDGEFIHCASGAADFEPRHPRDDQFYQIVDVRDPAKPEEVGRWWLPGTREGDGQAAPPRLYDDPIDSPGGMDAFRAHNTNVYPERPDRAYVGYIDGGRQQITPWLYRSLYDNKPYDRFARELISPTAEAEGFIKGIKWRGNVNASRRKPLVIRCRATRV